MSWSIDAKLENLERELKNLREETSVIDNELRHQLAVIEKEQITIQLQIWAVLLVLLIIFVILTWRFWLSILVWLGIAWTAFFTYASATTGVRPESIFFGLLAVFFLIYMCVEWWNESPAKAYFTNLNNSHNQEQPKVNDELRMSLHPHREADTEGYSHRMALYHQEAQSFLDKNKSK
jgi:hypothetical protein